MNDNRTKPRIAVLSGPTATIQNSEPLVMSNKKREKNTDYRFLRIVMEIQLRFRTLLRPQRLVAPVTVYVEQF